jgi:putative oxidoreductase
MTINELPRQLSGPMLSLFRAVVGLLFMVHGIAKLFGLFGGARGGGTVEVGTWPSWYAALIELVCGGLVLLGLGTRIAALICSGSMAYAYFTVHQPDAFMPIQNGGELAAVYSFAFLLIAILGPGAVAMDTLFSRQRADLAHVP